MELHLNAVTLGVVDLERATRFYADVLGLPQRPSLPATSVFELGQGLLVLRPPDPLVSEIGVKRAKVSRPRDVFPGFTLAYHVGSEADVDRLLAEVATRGGRVVKLPQRAGPGGYAGYFADNDGYLWEVACAPHAPTPDELTPPLSFGLRP